MMDGAAAARPLASPPEPGDHLATGPEQPRDALRVALVTDTYLPEINGVTTVLRTMREGLARRGHQVLVIAPRYDDCQPGEAGIVRRASLPFPLYPAVRMSLPTGGPVTRALGSFRPDVVHVATEGPMGLVGRRWAPRRGIPLVTSFHTDFPRYAGRYAGDWAVGPVRRYCAWFHGPARLTQTPSAETAAELRVLGLAHVQVWGRGVDPSLFTPARRSEARRLAAGAGGAEDRVVVLHVGRLAREKDTDVLIDSCRLIQSQVGHRVVFAVSGDGPDAPRVRRELPFARHHGFLDRERLADVYADSDIFLFPSPTETCGLVALEAMASGVPVVAADRGGVLENLRPEVNGLLATAGDGGAFARAVVELVRDQDRRRGLAAGARAWAQSRSWEGELEELERMYLRVKGRTED